MKLRYITHWRFPSEKTMSPLIMKTCAEFARQGFEVELITPWRSNVDFKGIDPFEYHNVEQNFVFTKIPGIDFHIPGMDKIRYFVMTIAFALSLVLYELFRSNKDVVYYSHDIRDIFLLAFIKKNIFLEIHDFYKTSSRFFNAAIFKRISGFISTNKIKMDVLHNEYDIPYSKMIHKPNAVSLEQFAVAMSKEEAQEKLSIRTQRPVVLYFGHLFNWKGVDTLLEAHKELKDFDIYFVGGTKPDIERMKHKAQNMQATNVYFAGHRPHAEAAAWFSLADVLVLPNTGKMDVSKYETSPVKLFEYMASGRPIVASRLPSIESIVTDDMVWFFEPDNSTDLAQVIIQVISDPKRDVKTKLARQEVNQYTWEKRVITIREFIYDTTA